METPYRLLREGWLPILFLLVYLLGWLGWWLWRLLLADEEDSSFPDIDQAWDEAKRALSKAGLGLSDAPLFLILGRTAEADEGVLFGASQLPWTVNQAPARKEAPLHVWANPDGIYVTCVGASLLGQQAAILAGEVPSDNAEVSSGEAASFQPDKTLTPGKGPEAVRKIESVLSRVRQEGRSYDQLSEEERREIARLEKKDRSRPSLLKDTHRTHELTARLAHLCRLIVRDRRPYCPANGFLLLIPLAATEQDESAAQTGDICRRDLETVCEVFRINCPLLSLVCDLETADGFQEFAKHFSQEQRQQRLGQRFPYAADLSPETWPRWLDDMVSWLCLSVLPTWVYRFLRLETPGQEETADVVQGNGRLIRFLEELRVRRGRLSRLLTRALTIDAEEPLLFGGCYLAATGATGSEQAFVPGIFRRLVKDQSTICWTKQALASDQAARSWVVWGYTALGLVVAGLIVAIATSFLFSRRG